MSLFGKTLTSLAAAAACSFAILLTSPAPATAQTAAYNYYYIGAFGSQLECDGVRVEYHNPHNGEWASGCYFTWSPPSGGSAGYYFTWKVSGLPD